MAQQSDGALELPALVDHLRVAQRALVRELGITRGFERELGATLTQCHALIEIERTVGLSPGELGDSLLIEQSTASRLVERLRDAGWVRLDVDEADARRRRLSLTPAGRRQVKRGHERADAEAAAALGLLAPSDRATVVRGLQLYAKALARKRRLDGIVIRDAVAADAPVIRDIVVAALAEFQVVGRPNPSHDGDLDDLARFYRRPHGAYFVAVENGRPIGGAGIAPLPNIRGACELRKMYLVEDARGLGLGHVLLQRCLAMAGDAGHSTCYANTLARMSDACRLYESAGFTQTASPVAKGLDSSGCDRWYALSLPRS